MILQPTQSEAMPEYISGVLCLLIESSPPELPRHDDIPMKEMKRDEMSDDTLFQEYLCI